MFLYLSLRSFFFFFFFFFQAEDGIRDLYVTGVQTCALPICPRLHRTGSCEVDGHLARFRRRHVVSRPHAFAETAQRFLARDRKSTRLNSSHVEISYAVFCLKKKKKKKKNKIQNKKRITTQCQ